MKKKNLKKVISVFAALFLCLSLLSGLSGCVFGPAFLIGSMIAGAGDEAEGTLGDRDETDETGDRPDETEETRDEAQTRTSEAAEEETSGESDVDPEKTQGGPVLSVDSDSGELQLNRPDTRDEKPMGAEDTWTILVYLCGTDLESAEDGEGGAATSDLEEMCTVSADGRVRFLVETGGTAYWYNHTVSAGKSQRFLISGDGIEKVDESGRKGMGESQTLADFIEFGVQNYPAEKMGLVLWNHGGGSITGVCFDELYDNDSLSLREIGDALSKASAVMTDRFEFIGFDACLMGSLEMANIAAGYARYMVGSEEYEPGNGWDYAAIAGYLSAHPDADGKALGKVICDSFYTSCEEADDADIATLSVVDLEKLDPLLVAFNRFAQNMYEAGSDSEALTQMVRGIRSAENFGGNNRMDGYSNMVDLKGLVSACEGIAEGTEEVLQALADCVVFQVLGADHPNASGLSLYYPLEIQGSSELSIFSRICVSPYYLSFVDRLAHGSVSDGDTEEYDDGVWFWNEGSWFFPEDGEEDYDDWNDGYWDYLDEYEGGGESSLITFEYPPQLDEEGSYCFILDDDGYWFTSDVYACVYQLSPDEEDNIIELGETIDVYADWETGYFADEFDGYWISLPDGQNLALYLVDITDDYVIYTSPVYLNDAETNLRLRQYFDDGRVTVEGCWDGINEYGASDREIRKLKPGDVLIPRYSAWNLDTGEELEYTGQEYAVTDETALYYDLMDPGEYYYAFDIEDIYGDYFLTDFVAYTVEEDGTVNYYTD